MPIDPTYPEDRTAFMLKDCSADIVLKFTDEKVTIPEGITVINLADESIWNGDTSDTETLNKPEDAIYCIYTSGTTGIPKGVVIEHKGVVNFVRANEKNEFLDNYLQNCDTVYSTNRIIFDITVQEIFIPLCNGKKIVLSHDEYGIIKKRALTV